MKLSKIQIVESTQKLGLKVLQHDMNKENIPCHCPFHEDRHPSFYLHSETGQWKCFSCGRGGNLNTLSQDLMGISIFKLLDITYNEFLHTEILETNNYKIDYNHYMDSIEINTTIKPENLLGIDSEELKAFLDFRGISYKVAEAMKFAFCKTGTINNTFITRRVLIPIYESQKLINVECRAVEPVKAFKVLYPDNSSTSTLYDLDNLDKNKELYIVEGLMDLAILREDDFFKNSTCTFGSNISDRQIWLLNQFNKVVVIPDNDKAGDACIRKLKKNLNGGFKILRVPYPQVKDVGELKQKVGITVSDLLQRKWVQRAQFSTNM